ncbi:AbiV family abortive infection protein [Simiduia aestuariiviva]|uniref:AbiV family abortive infection protein n=1 Tax=Simiduia aestuariiviva TaxID=1510459 RepID=A0A839UQ97_9GAMM|nr:AbiV family abortive infection protein [Simiduia aestuariiviva]
MKKGDGISKYKLNRIATESLRNAIRLHFDSVLLYENGSYPSALQLSVLALEEFAKANWVDHYIWSSETNEGYPTAELEQEWLKLLYLHPKKQWSFVARDTNDYSPKFISLIQSRKLEEKKQNAVYVGLSRSKGMVDIESRISTPWKVKQNDAKQFISIINDELLRIFARIEENEFYFEGGSGMDEVFDYHIYNKLLRWPHRSGIKNNGWRKKSSQRN